MERKRRDTKKDHENKINPKQRECPECGSDNVFVKEELDQVVCNDCGAIFEELTPEEEKRFEKVRKR